MMLYCRSCLCYGLFFFFFFFFKQKTAYEMRISDWSSDVCSSDLHHVNAEVRSGRRKPGDGDDYRKRCRHHGDAQQPQKASQWLRLLPLFPTVRRSIMVHRFPLDRAWEIIKRPEAGSGEAMHEEKGMTVAAILETKGTEEIGRAPV